MTHRLPRHEFITVDKLIISNEINEILLLTYFYFQHQSSWLFFLIHLKTVSATQSKLVAELDNTDQNSVSLI